ncbi:MAG: hypothetical protein JWR17_5163 [Pseudomonas sp.]|nr:hypothetical protein [Pseudomonas sp.]
MKKLSDAHSLNTATSLDTATLLRSLRSSVQRLEQIELAEVTDLAGHQTVDTKQSLSQCFALLHTSITEMEETLSAIAEATGARGKR